MKKYLIVFFLAGGFYCSNAQTTTDSVYVVKSFLGYKFYQNDMRLNFNQLPFVMEENGEAYYVIKKAKSNYTASTVLSSVGGFLLGWQIGSAIFSGNPNWGLAGVGGGLIIVSIPFFTKSFHLSLDAIERHNSALSGATGRLELNFGATGNGVGLIMRF